MARFVTFPGTAGSYASTDDDNELTADDAHIQQSIGGWDGWFGGGAQPELSTEQAAFGDSSGKMLIIAGNANASAGARLVGVAVTDATAYTATVDIYFVGTPHDFLFDVTAIGSVTASHAGTGWQTFNVSGTTSAATTEVRVARSGAGTEVTFYFDKVCVRQGTDSAFVPSLRIVGDLDLRIDFAATDWTPPGNNHLIDVFGAANDRWTWQYRADGLLHLFINGGSLTNHSSTVPTGLTDGTQHSLRATFTASDAVRFFVDDVQLGADVPTTQAFIQSANANTLPVSVGADADGNSPVIGDMYAASARDGIDGPIVAVFDPDDITI